MQSADISGLEAHFVTNLLLSCWAGVWNEPPLFLVSLNQITQRDLIIEM